MSHRDITLSFIRFHRAGEGARRAVERCVVRVPEIEASTLTKAAVCPHRGPLVEQGGNSISYYGNTRSTTSIDSVTDMLDRRVRHKMQSQKTRPPESEAVGDGRAALDAQVRAFEAGHVVVEDCLARRVPGPRIEIFARRDGSVLVTDGYPPEPMMDEWKRRPGSAPWMSFPLAHRERALAVADAIAGMTRGKAADGHAERDVALGIEVIDHAAVERWVHPEFEARFVRDAAGAILVRAETVAGGLTRKASTLLHDLRDAVAGQDEATVREALAFFADEVAASPEPETGRIMPWTGFRAAAKAIVTRLDMDAPVPGPLP